MYLGFQSSLWGGQGTPIPSEGSPKEYIDYEKEHKGLSFLKNGSTHFCLGCIQGGKPLITYRGVPKVIFRPC